jgi:DNA-binding HxlR family transcriptional regulator
MTKFKTLIALIAIVLSSTATADELLVEVSGSASKTAGLPNSIYEARAIANALQSIVQSGAQSLESFSLVENGKVLFDQISTQSDVKIAGYRIKSTKKSGDKFTATLEVLLIPAGNKKNRLSCRQPENLDIAILWKGIKIKKSMPFWLSFDQAALLREVTNQVSLDGKFNLTQKSIRQDNANSGYSLYEVNDAGVSKTSDPKYSIALSLELDTTEYANPLQREKTLVVKATSDLIRKGKIVNSVTHQTDASLDKHMLFTVGNTSGRKSLGDIRNSVVALANKTVSQVLQKLECKNFVSKVTFANQAINIDYGLQDGLLPSDIFNSIGPEGKQYYFTVKEMKNNYTTLHSLSEDTTEKLFDGMSIKLLERF